MTENYAKKQTYEFCEIRGIMVRLDVIQVTVTMPDLARAQLKLTPVDCNRIEDCKRQKISCMVFEPNGQDPCPGAWE